MSKQHAPSFLALVENAKKEIKEITITQFLAMTEPYKLIDIREDHEWQNGFLPKAIHLGKGIIERDIENMVPDKSALIVLYCGGGFRSALSAQTLQQMGYTNVLSLAGGYRDWCDNKLPLEGVK